MTFRDIIPDLVNGQKIKLPWFGESYLMLDEANYEILMWCTGDVRQPYELTRDDLKYEEWEIVE